ncbi:peripheral myelin protein 22-like [Ciona intestinalis]
MGCECYQHSPYQIAGSVLSGIVTGLFVPAMTVVGWHHTSSATFGLYQSCFTLFTKQCIGTVWNLVPGLDAARILFIIAACVLGLKLFISFGFCITKKYGPLILALGVCDLIGGLVILSGCIAYTVTFEPTVSSSTTDASFGVAFYLGWFAGPFSVAAGICNIYAGKLIGQQQCGTNVSDKA